MPTAGVHRLSSNHPLPLLPDMCRYGDKVWFSKGRAERVINGYWSVVEFE